MKREVSARVCGLLVALMLCIGVAAPASAIGPHEALPDAAQEARARDLFRQLRCLVCQNQSIDDSDADLARDLRVIVRERIHAGESDAQVIAFLTQRYGDFVLLKPPFKTSTLALWATPFALLLIGGVFLVRRGRRPRGADAAAPLNDGERARLADLLRGDYDRAGGGA